MKYLLIIFAVFLFSCSGHKEKAKPGEGTVVYRITYPDSIHYGAKTAFFPKEIILVFKNEKAAFIATGGMGMVQLVNLMDHQTHSYTSLLIDHLRGNYACKFTEADIQENERSVDYNFQFTRDSLIIAGVQCAKAIVQEKEGKQFDIAYDPAIKFYYWNSPFKDFNYLMLSYSHTINGLTMQLKATEVDLKNAVDTSLFTVKGNYQWVNKKEFFNHLSTL